MINSLINMLGTCHYLAGGGGGGGKVTNFLNKAPKKF